jgi:heterodisulfide reductase subunit C
MIHPAPETEHAVVTLDARLAPIRRMMRACIQCGTCSASCPNAFAMEMSPRRVWRCLQTGCLEEIFDRQTFTLCSSCYYCTLRCPRGLQPADAMTALKRIAAEREMPCHRASTLFYRQFLRSVRRHGRVNEMEIMAAYFAQMKNPLRPWRYAALGWKLQSKGKIHRPRLVRGKGKLNALFAKVAIEEKCAD